LAQRPPLVGQMLAAGFLCLAIHKSINRFIEPNARRMKPPER
jgi:hypothetical protein